MTNSPVDAKLQDEKESKKRKFGKLSNVGKFSEVDNGKITIEEFLAQTLQNHP